MNELYLNFILLYRHCNPFNALFDKINFYILFIYFKHKYSFISYIVATYNDMCCLFNHKVYNVKFLSKNSLKISRKRF